MLWDSAAEGNGWGQTRPSQAWRNGPFFLLYLVPLVFYGWLKPVWDIGGSFYCLAWKKSLCKIGSQKLVPFSNNTMFVIYHKRGLVSVAVALYLDFRSIDSCLPQFSEYLLLFIIFCVIIFLCVWIWKQAQRGDKYPGAPELWGFRLK